MFGHLKEIVTREAAEFILANGEHAMIFQTKAEIREHAIRRARKDGLLLEFGVNRGFSLALFANQLAAGGDPRPIHGFDSFCGLREDWTGTSKAVGRFDQKGALPDVPANARLVPGWIEDTLPSFLAENPGPIAFIHLDTDTYGPASCVLKACKSRLAPGSLILFDELIGYPNWRSHEFRALRENFADGEFQYVAFAEQQALVAIV